MPDGAGVTRISAQLLPPRREKAAIMSLMLRYACRMHDVRRQPPTLVIVADNNATFAPKRVLFFAPPFDTLHAADADSHTFASH